MASAQSSGPDEHHEFASSLNGANPSPHMTVLLTPRLPPTLPIQRAGQLVNLASLTAAFMVSGLSRHSPRLVGVVSNSGRTASLGIVTALAPTPVALTRSSSPRPPCTARPTAEQGIGTVGRMSRRREAAAKLPTGSDAAAAAAADGEHDDEILFMEALGMPDEDQPDSMAGEGGMRTPIAQQEVKAELADDSPAADRGVPLAAAEGGEYSSASKRRRTTEDVRSSASEVLRCLAHVWVGGSGRYGSPAWPWGRSFGPSTIGYTTERLLQ